MLRREWARCSPYAKWWADLVEHLVMYLQNMDASFLAQELARWMREVVPSGIKITTEEDMLWFESDSYSAKPGPTRANGCTREMENRSAYSPMRAGTLLMIFKTLLMRPPLNLGRARTLHQKRVPGWKMAPSFCGSVMPRLQTSSSNRCRSWHSEGVTPYGFVRQFATDV
jgi:hypothetical protein